MFSYVLPYGHGGESGGQQCPAETTPLTKARRAVQGTSETAPHDESDGGPLRFALPPCQAMNAAAAPKGSDGLWLPVRP